MFAPLIASGGTAIAEKANSIRANGWQPAQATVHQVKVWEDRPFWRSELSYSYSWEGEFYSGFRRRDFGREKAADLFVGHFPRGASVLVRVNPDNPEKSLLLFDEQFVRI